MKIQTKETAIFVSFIVSMVLLFGFIAWRVNIIDQRKDIEKQAKLTELAVIRDDIQNIYS